MTTLTETGVVLGFVALFMSLPATCSTCKPISIFGELSGYHCKYSDVMTTLSLHAHQCNLLCIQKTMCSATNYNTSDHTCTLLHAPCSQAKGDATMIYNVFSGVVRECCVEWVDYSATVTVDERFVKAKTGADNRRRFVAQMAYSGNIYPCYMYPPQNRCYGTNGAMEFDSRRYPCQLLRVRDGCTVAFVSYTAGNTLPFGAVHTTNPADCSFRYIAIATPTTQPGIFAVGYYDDATPCAVIAYYGIHQEPRMELLTLI